MGSAYSGVYTCTVESTQVQRGLHIVEYIHVQWSPHKYSGVCIYVAEYQHVWWSQLEFNSVFVAYHCVILRFAKSRLSGMWVGGFIPRVGWVPWNLSSLKSCIWRVNSKWVKAIKENVLCSPLTKLSVMIWDCMIAYEQAAIHTCKTLTCSIRVGEKLPAFVWPGCVWGIMTCEYLNTCPWNYNWGHSSAFSGSGLILIKFTTSLHIVFLHECVQDVYLKGETVWGLNNVLWSHCVDVY